MTPFLTIVIATLVTRLSYQMARTPVLPRFAQDLGAAPELIGLIVAASTITGAFFKLPAGALSDIWGRKRMMLLGALFFAVPPFLYLFITEPYALLALRFVHGFATAIYSPVAGAAVADLFQRGRGEKLGWFASAGDVGATVGPLIGGFILFYTASFQATYVLVGLLGLLPILIIRRLPDDPPIASKSDRRWAGFRAGIVEVISNRAVLIASAMEASLYLGYGALVGFLPIYARAIGFNDAEIGLILGAQLGTTMLAKPLTGKLSDRLGRKPMILAGLILCAAILPLIPLTRPFTALCALSALFGLGVAIVTPSTTALVADLVKAGRMGSAMGVFGTIWDLGEAAGPIIAGAIIGGFGYFPAFGMIALWLGFAAILFGATVRDPQGGQNPKASPGD